MKWIAKRLGITRIRAKEVVENLEQLGLLSRDPSGQWKRTNARLDTADDVESKALQFSHLESLKMAKGKLKEVAVEDRDFSSLTFAINKNCLQEAKVLIHQLQDQLSSLFERDDVKSDVYLFCGQLFPATKD